MQSKRRLLVVVSCILAAVISFGLTACTIDIHTKNGEDYHIDLNDVDWEALGLEDPEKERPELDETSQIQLNEATLTLLKIFMDANGYGSYYSVIEEAYEKDPDVLRSVFETGSVDGLVRLFLKESLGSENKEGETPKMRAFPYDLGG